MEEEFEQEMNDREQRLAQAAETLAQTLGLDAVQILTVDRRQDGTEITVSGGHGLLVARVELCRGFVVRYDNDILTCGTSAGGE